MEILKHMIIFKARQNKKIQNVRAKVEKRTSTYLRYLELGRLGQTLAVLGLRQPDRFKLTVLQQLYRDRIDTANHAYMIKYD